MARLGVLGGTFDPPHIGHLVLAAEAAEQLGLHKVFWVLTPDPPHKPGRVISPVSTREKMLSAALADNPIFELSRVDLDRPAPHYAVGTVVELSRQFPHSELVYLMGGDSLRDLPTWHNPPAFLAACAALGVMRRPGHRAKLAQLEQVLPGITAKTLWIKAPLLEISASDIRQRVAQGRTYRYLVSEAVYGLIEEFGLYR